MSFEKPWGNYLLEEIVETNAPEPISFLPQTIAWQIIFLLVIILLIKKSYQAWQNYQANAYRREALTWLAQCSLTDEDDIRQLPTLIRKTALIANKVQAQQNDSDKSVALKRGHEITKLRGLHWTKWLDLQCSQSNFQACSLNTSSCTELLDQLAYIPNLDLEDLKLTQALVLLCQQIELWIKCHDLSIATKLTSKEASS